MNREAELRRALTITAAILQLLAQGHEGEIVKILDWSGTIGEALDIADAALNPEASA
jgi:hypothetical protein